MTRQAQQVWKEKLELLLVEEAKAVDPELKFKIQKNIEEVKAKLAELDPESGLASATEARAPNKTTAPCPHYPDETTRELARSLEQAYRSRALLLADGEDTTDVNETILDLRRKIREGGQLKEGDFLLDGRFQLLEMIGRGGFAQVWRAYDQSGHDVVAIKVLHGQHTRDESRRERFFRGARHMARLQHPGIVRVIEEECEDGGYFFFVMEYVGRGDLRQAVKAGRLSPEERLKIIREVGKVLTFAHERGVIHRDVKPGNVLLDKENRPKLTDFDLVRAADTTGGTRTTGLGTFLYAAPEAMMDAKTAAEPADVYGPPPDGVPPRDVRLPERSLPGSVLHATGARNRCHVLLQWRSVRPSASSPRRPPRAFFPAEPSSGHRDGCDSEHHRRQAKVAGAILSITAVRPKNQG